MQTILAVDLTGSSESDGWIKNLLIEPLASNMNVFVNLTYAILALLAILTAYRIYINWQAGTSENTVSEISRWMLGMVLCVFLIAGLKAWMAANPVGTGGVEFNFE
ncbi:hypothetical protein GCM10007423_63680 [Dyadobacter endophyticus]|uniref:DUF4134 domain-containing protein n=1 Tax=Dyadobacter endophyticus TaxID=1749036 RepID=A0ABQ1ZDL2_9BACT|nr:DUF4134 family protein [Dyadobacter endophyticus]MBE8971305.1 DUF4134 family protein [Nostocales cyanobacterium LEGE 12452]GGH55771.1 hypothetical protein GCM10007423_63680 [Dyadobacter endophyticus]